MAVHDKAIDLREVARIVRRHRLVIALTTVIVVLTTVGVSFAQPKTYQGKAKVLLQPDSADSLFNPNTGQRNDPTRAVQTEIEVLKSQPVRAAVRKRLGSAPKVTAEPVGQTDLIDVKARSGSPQRAARIANAYAESYIDFRRRQAVTSLLAAAREIQQQLDVLQNQIDALDVEIAAGDPDNPASTQGQQARRDSLLQQHALFGQKLDQLRVETSLKTGGAQVVTPASPATTPVSPRPVRNGALAVIVGLMLGGAFAYGREQLDDSIKSKEDVDRVLHGVSTLALIPDVTHWKDRTDTVVVSLSQPTSPAAEAYRTLRTAIQFAGLDRPMRTVQFTSPNAGEGKTTTIANLAVALANAGQRTIMVCCDLRRPRIHEFFGLRNRLGFTSVLLGEADLDDVLQDVPGIDGLRLLASGREPPNPSEMLSSPRTVELLMALQARADIVLIDSPPVLPVTDAAVLAGWVDASVLVATAGSTTRKELGRARELLGNVDAPLIGLVLNGMTSEGRYGYGYGYGGYASGERLARVPERG